jgi:hypothetical protein
MTIWSPTFTMVCGGMLLALAMSVSDLPYWRVSFISVSPGAMTCTMLPPAAVDLCGATEPVTSLRTGAYEVTLGERSTEAGGGRGVLCTEEA